MLTKLSLPEIKAEVSNVSANIKLVLRDIVLETSDGMLLGLWMGWSRQSSLSTNISLSNGHALQ